ncbi:XRE family transcriptional regulator [Phytoactinopolyspora sp. XMNu-373]|uniref:XRE family transcriptional regulator n=2 Tax=Phytoactinopolyspora mesophila TaxID=2650750 RepID=A0A7K3MAR3_9ACTN|nr:XRE family transcriptional regulator [Phytoactinopolyspora mesophila]
MDRAELARYLDVAPSTISAWVSREKMPQPARHVGRSPLWRVREIDAWEASRPGKGWRSQL